MFSFTDKDTADFVADWLNSPAADYGFWKYGCEWGWFVADIEDGKKAFPEADIVPVPDEYLEQVREWMEPDNQKERLRSALEFQAEWYKSLPLPAGMQWAQDKLDDLIV